VERLPERQRNWCLRIQSLSSNAKPLTPV
jgi:hypothetical protein